MVDTNRTFFITEHAHFDEESGAPLFCPPLQERIQGLVKKGFEHGEIYVTMLPDGTLDLSDAMHIMWKEGPNAKHLYGG